MAKYRVKETISYVHDGKVVSVQGGRGKEVELTDEQASKLRGKVVRLAPAQDNEMFPGNTYGPVIEPVVVTNPAPPVEQEIREVRKPVKAKAAASSPSSPTSDAPKPGRNDNK